MILKGFGLKNFRNYRRLEIELSPDENILVGGNAQGKSNLLEGVYFLSHLKSNRAIRMRELVLEGEEKASVKGTIIDGEARLNIEATIGKAGRKVELNGREVESAAKARGLVKCVMFSPDDLYIVKGDPARRREFLDEIVEGLGPVAAQTLVHYRRVLRQRNAFIRSCRVRGGTGHGGIEPWNESLARAAAVIVSERAKIIKGITTELQGTYREVSGDRSEVGMRYDCTIEPDGPTAGLEEEMKRRLESSTAAEERAGTTVIGPHRDDIVITLGGRTARFTASQGEQRTIAFCMRIAQAGYLEKHTGKKPILLLDDVLSELDTFRRRGVLGVAGSGMQTLITTTEVPEEKLGGTAKILRVESGSVSLG